MYLMNKYPQMIHSALFKEYDFILFDFSRRKNTGENNVCGSYEEHRGCRENIYDTCEHTLIWSFDKCKGCCIGQSNKNLKMRIAAKNECLAIVSI